jgi:hypothetical protein
MYNQGSSMNNSSSGMGGLLGSMGNMFGQTHYRCRDGSDPYDQYGNDQYGRPVMGMMGSQSMMGTQPYGRYGGKTKGGRRGGVMNLMKGGQDASQMLDLLNKASQKGGGDDGTEKPEPEAEGMGDEEGMEGEQQGGRRAGSRRGGRRNRRRGGSRRGGSRRGGRKGGRRAGSRRGGRR